MARVLFEHVTKRYGGNPVPAVKDLNMEVFDREFLVLRLIASGKTPTAIAKELALSVKTISTYRMRILEKMSMSNNAELTHYAIQNQLV